MSISDKLVYLSGTKEAIKDAIEQKGVTVPEETTFREYADKISQISGGGGGGGNIFTLEMGALVGGAQGIASVTFPPHDAGDVLIIVHMRTTDDALTATPPGFTEVGGLSGITNNYMWYIWRKVSEGSDVPLIVGGIELTSNGQHAYPLVIKGGDFLYADWASYSGSVSLDSWRSEGPWTLPKGDSIVFVDYYTTSASTSIYPQYVELTSAVGVKLNYYCMPMLNPSDLTADPYWWNNVAVKFRSETTAEFTSWIRRSTRQGSTITKYHVPIVFTSTTNP